MEKVDLLGAAMEEIEGHVSALGEPRYRARQIFAGIYRRRYRSWDRFTDLGKALRADLDRRFAIRYPDINRIFESADGTRRYLFALAGQEKIEAVLIPEPRRDTVCISTQVGCAVECIFCVTGKLPMRRNLSCGEIVGQVLALQSERETPGKRLNVVIMGMGEPLHNYDNVMKAVRLMTQEDGISISPRRITLSTSGVLPGIERLAGEPILPNLAISLNATTDAVRDLLIPINRKWDIASLMEACRRFSRERRRRITFEYVLMEGVNDSPADARRLVSLLQGMKRKVNLIPLNADPWIPLRPSSPDRVLAFQQILADHGVAAHIRKPRGDDVSAACGMLAGRDRPQGDERHPPPLPASPEDVARLVGER